MTLIEKISFLLGDSTVVTDVQPGLLGFKTKKKKRSKEARSEQLCRRIQ